MSRSCPQCGLHPLAPEWSSCPRCGLEFFSNGAPASEGRRWSTGRTVAVLAVVASAAAGVSAVAVGTLSDRGTAPTAAAETSAPPREAAHSDATWSNAEIAREFGDSVYRLEATGCGGVSSGTAWVLDEHHLVTNWHVVASDPTPAIVARDGSTLTGQVIGASTEPDVAVVRTDGTLTTPLSWADTAQLTEGQDLVSLGYPAPALDFSVTAGSIVSFQMADDQRQAIRSDGALDKGNSGGPALTDTGQVAGVVTQMAANTTGLQLVPLLFTADALQGEVSSMVANPRDIEADCAPSFGVVPDGWTPGDGSAEGAQHYGDDPELDALQDACEAGDMSACDDLYWSAGYGTGYEEVAASCGGHTAQPAYGWCEWEATAAEAEARAAAEQEAAEAEAAAEAERAREELTSMVAGCEGGDMQACDDLAVAAEWGSSAEDVADTCGGHYPDGWGSCTDRQQQAGKVDQLVSQCQGGDMQACDDLSLEADYGTDAYQVGEDCGGHYPDAYGMCVYAEQEAQELQEYYDQCAAGDMVACDDLYLYADYDSTMAEFGSTCGGRHRETYGMCDWEYGR